MLISGPWNAVRDVRLYSAAALQRSHDRRPLDVQMEAMFASPDRPDNVHTEVAVVVVGHQARTVGKRDTKSETAWLARNEGSQAVCGEGHRSITASASIEEVGQAAGRILRVSQREQASLHWMRHADVGTVPRLPPAVVLWLAAPWNDVEDGLDVANVSADGHWPVGRKRRSLFMNGVQCCCRRARLDKDVGIGAEKGGKAAEGSALVSSVNLCRVDSRPSHGAGPTARLPHHRQAHIVFDDCVARLEALLDEGRCQTIQHA